MLERRTPDCAPATLPVNSFLSATIKDWLGITPEPNYYGLATGPMIEMGAMCLPGDWPGTGPNGAVELDAIPPAPPAATRRSDS